MPSRWWNPFSQRPYEAGARTASRKMDLNPSMLAYSSCSGGYGANRQDGIYGLNVVGGQKMRLWFNEVRASLSLARTAGSVLIR